MATSSGSRSSSSGGKSTGTSYSTTGSSSGRSTVTTPSGGKATVSAGVAKAISGGALGSGYSVSGGSSGGGSSSSGGTTSVSVTPTTTGQFIDAKTGQGYSGVQKSPFDQPVAGSTVTTTTAFGTTTSRATTTRSSGGGGNIPSPTDTIKGVTAFANQINLQSSIANLEAQQQSKKVFEDAFGQGKSSVASQFEKNVLTNAYSQQQSIAPPSEQYLRTARGDIGTSGEKKVAGFDWGFIKEKFVTTPTISAETATTAYAGLKAEEAKRYYLEQQNQKINEISNQIKLNYESELNSKAEKDYVASLQARVNNGESVDKINQEYADHQKALADKYNSQARDQYDSWFDSFKNNEGKQYEQGIQRDIIKFNARYGAPRAKEIANEVVNSFKTGFAIGAGGSLIARIGAVGPRIAKVVGKIGLASQPIILGGFAFFSLGERGVREQELIKQYGFSQTEARDLARQEQQTQIIDFGAGYVGGVGGSYVGYKTVSTGISFVKAELTPNQNKIIDNLLRNKRIDLKPTRGQVTETQIQSMRIDPTKKQELLDVLKNTRQSGTILREYNIVTNTKGLSMNERYALAKLNLKAKFYQLTDLQGNVLRSWTIGETTTGRIGLGARESLFAEASGRVDKGTFTGKQISYRFDTSKTLGERFTIAGQTKAPQLKSIEFSKIKSTGQVTYPREGLFRIEGSKGVQVSGRRLIFENGKWVRSEIQPRVTTYKSAFVSKKLFDLDVSTAIRASDESVILGKSSSKLYKDVKGAVDSGGVSQSTKIIGLEVENIPPSRSMKSFIDESKIGASQGVVSNKGTTLIKKQKISPINLQTTNIAGELQSSLKGGLIKTIPSTEPILTPIIKLISDGKLQTRELRQTSFISPIQVSQNMIGERLRTTTGVKSGVMSQMGLMQQQQQIPQLKEKQMQFLAPIVRPITPEKLPPMNFQFGLPFVGGLGKVEVGGGQRGLWDKSGTRGQPRYSASLGSVLLGQKKVQVTKEQARALTEKRYSGFELRPQLEITNGKPKKKSRGIFGLKFK